MEKVLSSFLKRHQLNLNKEKLIVAVSTGLDSMCLLVALEKLFAPENIIIAHVNHQKRAEANAEEAYIKTYAKEHKLNYVIYHLPKLPKNNFQEEARSYRKRFFKKVLHENKAKYLFLAHHLDDDLETFIMRFLRGSSLDAYLGIEEISFEEGFFFLRPFLKTPKSDLLTYAKNNNITYFEDSSNYEDYYTRNRIRHHIIPSLEKENPQVRLKFLEFKDTLLGAKQIVHQALNEWSNSNLHYDEDNISFLKQAFLELSPFLQTEMLFRILKKEKLSKAEVDELCKKIKSNKPNLTYSLKNLVMVKAYEVVTFSSKINFSSFKPVILNSCGEYLINQDYQIIITKKSSNSLCNSFNLWYNSTMLPLIARPRQEGDSLDFTYGSKKVKKIFIDQKVPLHKRLKAIVLEKDGLILSLFGYATSKHLPPKEECDIVIELKENKI